MTATNEGKPNSDSVTVTLQDFLD